MAKLKTRVRGGLTRLAGRRPAPRKPAAGLPPRLDRELLDSVCRQVRDSRPRQVTHLNLSPFKDASGAYRVWCTTGHGVPWSLIFKDARYDHFDGPALGALPVAAGPTEYAVYATASGVLRDILPDVYHAAEVSPGRHYQYLLEDLEGAYGKPVRPREFIQAAVSLTTLSPAVHSWATSARPSGLIAYDQAYCRTLVDYAAETLSRYSKLRSGSMAFDALAMWPRVRKVVTLPEPHQIQPARGVHGDFNRASVMLPHASRESAGPKVIDWEWAGIGPPHLDLAALLDDADQHVMRRTVRSYAAAAPELDLSTHERLLRWAQVLMSVKNSAFLAAQLLDARTVTRIDRSKYIERLLTVALRTATRL